MTRAAAGAALLVRAMVVRRAFPRGLAAQVDFERPVSLRMHPLASRYGTRAPPFVLA